MYNDQVRMYSPSELSELSEESISPPTSDEASISAVMSSAKSWT